MWFFKDHYSILKIIGFGFFTKSVIYVPKYNKIHTRGSRCGVRKNVSFFLLCASSWVSIFVGAILKILGVNICVEYLTPTYTMKCKTKINKTTLPAHWTPSPFNPSKHEQLCEPLVFVQVAFSWHVWVPTSHSSMSKKM